MMSLSDIKKVAISVFGKREKQDVKTYDHAGRLMKTWHNLNAQGWVLLTMNEYNELGQLVTKKLHNTDAEQASDETRQFKQNVDYRYNIRGWLESVNDLSEPEAGDLFGMNLHYNNPTANGGIPQYNGNISEIQWKGPDAKTNSYGYNYDPMNRLTEANFHNETNGNRFNEHIKSPDNTSGYDLNGNIKYLQRNGKTGIDGVGITTYGEMDELKYEYRGNQLLKVTDEAIDTEGFIDGSNTDNDYAYDKNGNMIIDKNKSIDDATTGTGKSVISYNYLNLPEKVVKSNGEYLKYIYDATGRKLSQEVYNASNQLQKKSDYAGEFFYEDNSLKFVNHEEGRVVMIGTQGEYQYHLKDHLGNVRVTFTTITEVEDPKATMENANEANEMGKFQYYDEAVKINTTLFDHTNAGGTYYSTRLNGSSNERTGLARSISVMPGDIVKAEVYAKYLDINSANWTTALNNLITSIANGTAAEGTFVDGGGPGSTGGPPFPYGSLLNKSGETGIAPKAYLNYLIFDKNYNFLQGDFVPITTAAREYGQDGAHEKLATEFEVATSGYVYIYLSNDNEELGGQQVEVYFDDFKVEHEKSPVVQMDDYYPFGLTFNSYSRENSIPQDHKYNGKEEQKELGLGWLDYGMRMYQPELGRFYAQDRFAEKYLELTPYHYGANNPVLYVDINGDSIRVHFLDKKGNETGVIPQQVQNMFNSEYGIKVGYNSNTGMLYYEGEVETENNVSESAKETLVSALTDESTGSKAEKKYGNVFFGYGTFGARGPAKGFLEGATQGLKSGYAYIRLDNFDSNGNSTVRDYSSFDKLGISRRTYNMGRVFEHEWMGHVMRGTGDGTNTKPGKTEELINRFRTEMGLPHRLNYSGSMYFGPAGTNVRNLIRAANRGELVPVLPFKRKG